jgi:hypothetical protein
MATIINEGGGEYTVEGKVCTLRVLVSLDEINGALYHVWNEEDDKVGVRGDIGAALELAEQIADNGDPQDGDDEAWDGFNSDAEADADVLASAGWGTDEDYGCCEEMY